MQQKNLDAIVSSEYIQDYVEEHLPEGRWQSGGREWVCASPFLQNDYKRHFSINIHNGLWQCFKTGKKGNFIQLYAFLENVSPRAAWSRFVFKTLENDEVYEPRPEDDMVWDLDIDNHEWFEPLTASSNLDDPLTSDAFKYLHARHIFPDKDGEYYICRQGKYKDRLIIPYTEDDEIYYFQARTLKDDNPKYLNPGIEEGARAGNVLYPFNPGKVMVTEGPLDAISLKKSGFNATCTNGCNVSDVQALQLKDHDGPIVMAYDNDAAGKKGIRVFESTRKRLRMDHFYICYPPSSYRDWNDFLCKDGPTAIKNWVEPNTFKYESFYRVKEELGLL
ncbi:MAG TPA: hypothetical protein EYN64_03675 [Flavobacteriales bacterium]|nr:hypothetical protein [Flavobacteriales bacterium]